MYDGLPDSGYNLPHGVSDVDLEARFGCPEECEDCAVVENCGDSPDDCRGPFNIDDCDGSDD